MFSSALAEPRPAPSRPRLAKSRRPAGLQLWTFQTNVAAQRFYLRHGFTVAETTDGAGNEEKAPDIRFVWTGS